MLLYSILYTYINKLLLFIFLPEVKDQTPWVREVTALI